MNIKELTDIVEKGYFDRLGAKNIIRTPTSNKKIIINLKYASTERKRLQEGDIVERYLRDGDYVMMNRQPTLHRNSALAHEVVVMPGMKPKVWVLNIHIILGTTFRLNVMICPGYNADFDGDEVLLLFFLVTHVLID